MAEVRKDPITGRWIVVSAGDKRSSDLATERVERKGGPCVFCPGSEHLTPPEVFAYRAPESTPNTPGWRVRAVPHIAPALHGGDDAGHRSEGIYELMNGIGAHEVIIETPDHDRGLASGGDEPHRARSRCLPMPALFV